MDLLFSRYASPFLLLDNMLLTGKFSEYVSELLQIKNEEKDEQTLWEFFLHKVSDKSYVEFLHELNQSTCTETVSQEKLETTIKESYSMLNDFILSNTEIKN